MTADAPPRRWFFGPLPDLLLGCGLLYAGFFAAQALAGPEMRGALDYGLFPILTLLFGAPHYGATLLRVYEQRESRRRYAVFAVYTTLFLAAAYVVGLRQLTVGSLLVTVYITWSPWHYSGQNYGIAVLFLRRRGVPIARGAKRLLYGCFVLPYALVFLETHVANGSHYAPASHLGTEYRFLSLGIPALVQNGLGLLVEIGYLGCLAGAAWSFGRRARWRDLAPTAAVVCTQALWFALPSIAIHWGAFPGVEPLRPEFRLYTFMWIALGHFVQYLWITTYYAAASESRAGRARYLARTWLAGAAVWVLPTLVFAPGLLGRLPYDMGLGLLTAAVVNIHHFVLDGAIWKLRDGRIARALLRDPGDAAVQPPAPASGKGWIARATWALGAFCLLASLLFFVDDGIARRARTAGDLARWERVQERRALFGRDSPWVRAAVARQALLAGDLDRAQRHAERSLALYPTAEGHVVKAKIHASRGDQREELASYAAALALDPDHLEALHGSGVFWLRRGRTDLARPFLQRARALAPEDPRIVKAWAWLEAETSRRTAVSDPADP